MDEQTRAAYESARLGRPLQPGVDPAVVVVDLSLGFTDPDSPMGTDLSTVVEATASLLEDARRAERPVFFTTIAFDHGEHVLWMEKAPGLAELRTGSRWVDIDPRLRRSPGEPVIVKKGASAFFGTDLDSRLRSAGADTLVLCGATTSGCVRATAVDALQHGWPTLVVRECVGDRAEAPHRANLVDIDAKYADVAGLDDARAVLRPE